MIARSLILKSAAASVGSVSLFTAGTTGYYYGVVPVVTTPLASMGNGNRGPISKTYTAQEYWSMKRRFIPSNLVVEHKGKGDKDSGVIVRYLIGVAKLPNNVFPRILLFTDPSQVPKQENWPVYKFTYRMELEKGIASYYGRCNPILNSEGPKNSCAKIFLADG